MGQIRLGSATTMHAVRAAIQRSQASASELSMTYGINPKTVLKWRERATVEDRKTGPTGPCSTVLSNDEEAIIVAFRRYILLPLDDCLSALQPTIPHLSRSSRHRCLQRHGISRRPDVEGDKPAKKTFKRSPIGYFHIDLAWVHTAEGKLHPHVATHRTCKFAFTQLVDKANRRTATDFLEARIAAVPSKIHTILAPSHHLQANDCRAMDNGIQFTLPPRYRHGPTASFSTLMFGMRCAEKGSEHRPANAATPGRMDTSNA